MFISSKVCPLTSIEPKRQTLPEINVNACLFGKLEYYLNFLAANLWNNILHSFVGLQLCVLQPKVVKSEEEAPSLVALIKDPYILIAAGLSHIPILISSGKWF